MTYIGENPCKTQGFSPISPAKTQFTHTDETGCLNTPSHPSHSLTCIPARQCRHGCNNTPPTVPQNQTLWATHCIRKSNLPMRGPRLRLFFWDEDQCTQMGRGRATYCKHKPDPLARRFPASESLRSPAGYVICSAVSPFHFFQPSSIFSPFNLAAFKKWGDMMHRQPHITGTLVPAG